MSPILRSALAGCAATLPMTVWMLAAQRFLLPERERYPLPPERITRNAAEAAGLDAVARNESVLDAATLLNHFAYGAAAGTLYAPLRAWPASPALKGIALGTVVWSGSYLGLLPALGLLSPATRHPARRNALMIVAHVVWGGITGALAQGDSRGGRGR